MESKSEGEFRKLIASIDFSKPPWSTDGITAQKILALKTIVDDSENPIEEKCPNPKGLSDPDAGKIADSLMKTIWKMDKKEK